MGDVEENMNRSVVMVRNLIMIALLILLTGLFSNTTWSSEPILHVIPAQASTAFISYRDWENDLTEYLEQQDLPQFQVYRAIYFPLHDPRIRHSPAQIQAGIDRIRELLRVSTSHPEYAEVALYAISRQCRVQKFTNWCNHNSILQRLIDAAPNNIVVYFVDLNRLDLPFHSRLSDLPALATSENLQRLERAAIGTYVDEYSEFQVAKTRRLIIQYSEKNPPPRDAQKKIVEYYEEGIKNYEIRSYDYPGERYAWEKLHIRKMGPTINSALEVVPKICAAVAYLKIEASIRHCEQISRILYETGRDPDHIRMARYIDYFLELFDSGNMSEELWNDSQHAENKVITDELCQYPWWFTRGFIPIGGWQSLDTFYEDLEKLGYLESLDLAKSREEQALTNFNSDISHDDECYRNVMEQYQLRNDELTKLRTFE